MMTHKVIHSVDNNQCLKPLDTQLNESTNHNLIKVPKVDWSEENVILNFGDYCPNNVSLFWLNNFGVNFDWLIN